MKLEPANNQKHNTVTAYGDDYVFVNNNRHESNIVVMPHRIITDWTSNTFDTLADADMQQLAALEVEIVLLGTGTKMRFPRPELMRAFAVAQKGLEVMDLHAACRTYNLLASEGRKVASALLLV